MAEVTADPSLLYRDADVLIINKPAGLAVHAAPGAGATLLPLLEELRFGLKWLPGLAHRLDRDTSGCLVLGRHPMALRQLNALFAAGDVQKTYWAIVEGAPEASEGVIDAALLKVQRRGAWQMVMDERGQRAVTRWRVLGRGPGMTWLEVTPETGRMHQIRVHCAALGCPVLGDHRYGAKQAGTVQRLNLHARRIELTLHKRRGPISAEAPLPQGMALTCAECSELV